MRDEGNFELKSQILIENTYNELKNCKCWIRNGVKPGMFYAFGRNSWNHMVGLRWTCTCSSFALCFLMIYETWSILNYINSIIYIPYHLTYSFHIANHVFFFALSIVTSYLPMWLLRNQSLANLIPDFYPVNHTRTLAFNTNVSFPRI